MSSSETDRGWAWMIVVAVTIINVAILPIQQCFGLIFSERFYSLGITATQTSLILHLNGTITCSLGLISGPMMKRFTFREVAFFGGLTVAVGICITAFAVSVPAIIVSYCVIVGVGHGIMFPATSLAMNTYFRKKRNLAMGFSVTLTGLGPILMPLLIAKLLEYYATTGTLLILAGVATHSFIGASLLKPFIEKEITSITKGNDITASSAEYNGSNAVKRSKELKPEETEIKNGTVNCRLLNEDTEKRTEECDEHSLESCHDESKKEEKKSVLSKISKHLDLELLRDSRYVAVILVLSTWGNTYIVVVGVALIIGVAKGTKAVFQALIIPDYVPLERLPAASGMQMVCNGILSIIIGPIIGLVHDWMMSYVGALHFTSVLSLSCVILWYMGGLWRFNKSTASLERKNEAAEIQEEVNV
nr:PREDICTED: monocarboxylate transporter 14-like isoform X5 [Megachile rotundata]